MSATIWTEVESGSDRRSAPQRRQGYWSGNQGRPVRHQRFDRDELQTLNTGGRFLATR